MTILGSYGSVARNVGVNVLRPPYGGLELQVICGSLALVVVVDHGRRATGIGLSWPSWGHTWWWPWEVNR